MNEVRTRTGHLRFETGGDRFIVTAHGHVGPRLVREDLARAEAFGHGHRDRWWYIVDTTPVTVPNPLNLIYLRRIRALPGLAGYIVVAPKPPLLAVARLLSPISRPDAVVTSREAAEDFIKARRTTEALPVFVYDGDCGFCAAWAGWLSGRAGPPIRFEPFQALTDDSFHGITASDIEEASFFIDESGSRHRGSDGFAEVFKRSTRLWPLLGLVGSLPGPRQLAAVAYRLVARNRHRLPGPRAI
jgi:predicted DCC family thiol-disulfide oxidoreductase YuxK